ncbi:hypothetical protein FB451DRAFT_1293212 [Mycena latifolia]|nr:hypothetical protein FB451DRAFT_1293212 [Mycena latifolia]
MTHTGLTPQCSETASATLPEPEAQPLPTPPGTRTSLREGRSETSMAFADLEGQVDWFHGVTVRPAPVAEGSTDCRENALEAGGLFSLRRATSSMFKPEPKILPPSASASLRALLLGSCFVVRFVHGSANSQVFAFAFLGLLPVAKIFGLAMEDLTIRVNRHTGTFIRVLAGNTIELISGVIAIIQCQLEVLQASRIMSTGGFERSHSNRALVVGSILINILLVLGSAFFVGGIKFSEQGFGASATQVSSRMMMLATVATLLPTIFAVSYGGSTTGDLEQTKTSILRISRAVPLSYLLFVFFHNYSHLALYVDHSAMLRQGESPEMAGELRPRHEVRNSTTTMSQEMAGDMAGDIERQVSLDTEEEERTPSMSVPVIAVVVVLTCALISVLSEHLVGSLSNLTASTSLTKQWVGLILIPLAGTFARHDLLEAAVYGTRVKSMDDIVLISASNNSNLALCIQPILILLAWALHKNLALLYDPFETLELISLFPPVLVVNFSVNDGKSSWLSGAMLISWAISFWFYTGTHVFSHLISAC